MSEKPEALRLADAIDPGNEASKNVLTVDVRGAARELRRLHAECEALRAERDRLVEDRARFPDRPDDIGRMVSARFADLKSFAERNEKAWRAAQAKAETLAAECEALRADAGRLEWMAGNCERDGFAWWLPDLLVSKAYDETPTVDHLRAVVDAAMAKEQTK